MALHEAGLRSRAATQMLETRVAEAVAEAREAQATLLEARIHEAIGRLAGGVAHDFNNLLQTISTGHHLLQRSISEGPQHRVLQSVMRATAKAADLIRQMLAFGRAQNLEPESIDLADFVLKSQELASKAVGERILLTANIEPGLPPLFVDPTQLELALLNLIFNARDAMPNGGSIAIIGRVAILGGRDKVGEKAFVRIDVADNGPGIDENTLARVFEPYFTTKSVGAGSGLGLAQALAFARQSGGEIDIQSKLGVGTTVSMCLPTSDVAPMQPRGVEVPASNRRVRHLHVLMVEDDALVASVVVSALQEAGHRVTACTSADAAFTLLAETQRFDILFTDVVMPGSMTGLDLVEWCRAHRRGLPTIVATGYSAQRSDLPVRMLRKPYAMSELLAALQEAASAPADDATSE
ncbi:ATP-binding protein [Variovorax sp. GT1P44]|uniref:ATP-binding protein n=1 Tax=Variovorax sp. GT1P44 TaxID=3443742 RepID=UPI003F46D609